MYRRASTARRNRSQARIRRGVGACIFVVIVVAVVTYVGLGAAGFWEPIP
jgi:hypothetical protein